MNAPQAHPFDSAQGRLFRRERERMDHPPEGGANGLEDRVKRPVKAGSVVPSFAKTGKAGAASFADVRARNIEDGPAPSADSSTFHGTGRRFFLYVFVVKFDLALPDYFIDDCVQIAFANSLL